ncbi:MAG: hypothetical protein Q8M08_02990 [Bacteroidales bacterium]|nr:hypothetical protein [Bacteroidales bacterium]
MSYTKQSGDPRQMTSRFASSCHTCGKPIKKGEEIIYWPNGKHAGHLACDRADFARSIESFQDEEYYREFNGRGDYR